MFYNRLKDPQHWQNVHGIHDVLNYGRNSRQNVKQRKKKKKCDNQPIKSVCETEETTYCHLNIPISQCSLSRIAWPWKFSVSFPANIILFLLILILVYSCGRSVIEWLSIIYLGLELNVDLSSFAPVLARFRGRDLFPLSLRIQIISVFVVLSSKLMLHIARLSYQKSIWRFIDLKIFWIP